MYQGPRDWRLWMRFWQASLRSLEMEAADVGDVGGVTHFDGEFGEWIGARRGESVVCE